MNFFLPWTPTFIPEPSFKKSSILSQWQHRALGCGECEWAGSCSSTSLGTSGWFPSPGRRGLPITLKRAPRSSPESQLIPTTEAKAWIIYPFCKANYSPD